jgi:hypothetical protein
LAENEMLAFIHISIKIADGVDPETAKRVLSDSFESLRQKLKKGKRSWEEFVTSLEPKYVINGNNIDFYVPYPSEKLPTCEFEVEFFSNLRLFLSEVVD